MNGYRCFFLDDHGHFRDVAVFRAPSEREAEQRAWTAFAQSPCAAFELWCGDRLLGKGCRAESCPCNPANHNSAEQAALNCPVSRPDPLAPPPSVILD